MLLNRLFGLLLICVWSGAAVAAPLRIAVAANFAPTLEKLAAHYATLGGVSPELVRGSSGKLYAQIRQGAPFDMFYSADIARPKALEESGFVVDGSRQDYARGRLVLWPVNKDGQRELAAFHYSRFAIANPRLAPYGRAAQDVLRHFKLEKPAVKRLVVGENIAQAYQFVHSKNADAGLLARAQMPPSSTDYWLIPDDWHRPIRQQRVVLTRCDDIEAARAFLAFLQTDIAKQIIRNDGYQLPTREGAE